MWIWFGSASEGSHSEIRSMHLLQTFKCLSKATGSPREDKGMIPYKSWPVTGEKVTLDGMACQIISAPLLNPSLLPRPVTYNGQLPNEVKPVVLVIEAD